MRKMQGVLVAAGAATVLLSHRSDGGGYDRFGSCEQRRSQRLLQDCRGS